MTKTKEIEFLRLVTKAHEAGLEAGNASTPVPMVVEQHADPTDDNSPVEGKWFVEGGACGFAWVLIRPATSSFARWAKKNVPGAHNDYYGGLGISCHEFGQSMQRKEAYCRAYAKVLDEAGIDCSVRSRMD